MKHKQKVINKNLSTKISTGKNLIRIVKIFITLNLLSNTNHTPTLVVDLGG